jgi:CheY-like chemotaxis protein
MGRELVSCEQGAPILVVDDKERNRYSFQAILADAGFEVEVANSGMEALRYLMSSPASLVLLDVQMPEINGFETARMIRQDDPPEQPLQ